MYSEINSFKNGGIGTIRLSFTDFVPLMEVLLPSKAKALFTVNSLRSRDISNIVSSLSNNLIDFDTPIHVVKGFQGVN